MRNIPLKGLMKKSPVRQGNTTRTDSTTRFDPITLQVDSTPVGSTKVKEAGYGFGAAVESGNENASMWKNKRDTIATNKVNQENIELSRSSTPGSGGMTPIMPGE
mgnify:CR=1 FL=1